MSLESEVKQTFLAIGNACIDSTAAGKRSGGSVLYSAVAAKKLGWEAVIATNFAQDYVELTPQLEGLKVIRQSGSSTTTFGMSYSGGSRRMTLERAGEKIEAESVVRELERISVNPDILFFCPVAGECGSELIRAVTALYPESLAVVTPQGWMRRFSAGGAVVPKSWSSAASILPSIDLLVLSTEDIAGNPDILQKYAKLTGSRRNGGIVVLTDGSKGATAYFASKKTFQPAFKARSVDPTGAGDVFATAFAIRYYETQSVADSLAFAHSAAAFVIEGIGASAIANRQMVESRLGSKN